MLSECKLEKHNTEGQAQRLWHKPVNRGLCINNLFDIEVKILTLWRPAGFGDFQKKKRLNPRGFAREFLRSGLLYRPSKSLKRRGKSSSLHSKKSFCLGDAGFLWVTSKWRTFRSPWPTLLGPGRQPLCGSILLKFLLETIRTWISA